MAVTSKWGVSGRGVRAASPDSFSPCASANVLISVHKPATGGGCGFRAPSFCSDPADERAVAEGERILPSGNARQSYDSVKFTETGAQAVSDRNELARTNDERRAP